MNESICIAVDSACDLPYQFIRAHGIRILPINLRLGNQLYRDLREPESTIHLYKSKQLEKNVAAETEAVSVREITTFIERELAVDYDTLLAITISSKRSEIYKNIRESVFVGSNRFHNARRKQGIDKPLRIRIIDSEAIFPGQGLLAFEACRLINDEANPLSDAVNQLEGLKKRIRGYLVPQSLYFLKNRASTKGDNNVGWIRYAVGGMLDIKPIIEAYHGETQTVDKAKGFLRGIENVFVRATLAMKSGLCINAVNMSYAGNPKIIEATPEYQNFLKSADYYGVTTLLSVMSTTAAINVGPGAFALAYAES